MISEKILIIDDDMKVIKSLRMILSKYELLEFTDGRKAIDYLKRPRDIHLVLLDVMMPEIDGLDALQEIKRLRKDISVIMMTAYATKDVAVQALRFQADDFIEKPFKSEELEEKIYRILKTKLYLNKNALSKAYRIEKIKEFIKRDFNKASLNVISKEMCLSAKYISRIFKEQEGITFRDYSLNVKINEAKYLLKNTAITVEELSYKLGYQNSESFMRIFKRLEKKTPTEYRLNVSK